jgi:REP element-mobilizing transposase RayT
VPRRPRCHLPEYGFFHVTSRGVGGAHIYLDDNDREAFWMLLTHVVEMFDWRLHAWCLMGTRYHLMVEAPRHRLSAGMHRLNGLYAQRFNRRHRRKGHLYEERFSSWLVEGERHLRAAVRYIVENPVRAKLCGDRRDWLWSWPGFGAAVTALADVPLPGTSEGLSLGRGRTRRRQDDVNLARAVDADDQLLFDVGASARAGHDRKRARKMAPDSLEQLRKARQDPVLGHQCHVDVRKQRAGPRLLGRCREHHAAGFREPVQRTRHTRSLDLGRGPPVHDHADGVRVAHEVVDEAHRPSR